MDYKPISYYDSSKSRHSSERIISCNSQRDVIYEEKLVDYRFIGKAKILIIGLVSFKDAKIEIMRNFVFHYILLYAH